MSSGGPTPESGNWPQYPPPPNYQQPGYGQPTQPGQGYPQAGYPPIGAQPGYSPYQPGYYPPGYGYAPPMPAANSGFAIASLICGILGLCVGLSSILAVIFGHLALNEIKRSNGQLGGRGMAIAGLILGYVIIGLGILIAILLIIASVAHPGSGTS